MLGDWLEARDGNWRADIAALLPGSDRAGIALGARWWRFGCGIFLGLALAIKYSGF